MATFDLMDRIEKMSDAELYSRYDEVCDLIEELTKRSMKSSVLDESYVFGDGILDLIQEREYINAKFVFIAVNEDKDIITPWEKRHWNEPQFKDIEANSSYSMTIHTIDGEQYKAEYQVFPDYDVEIYIIEGERYYSIFKIAMHDDVEWQAKMQTMLVDVSRWWSNLGYKTILGMPENYGVFLQTTNLLVSPNPTVGDMHNYVLYKRQLNTS